LKRGVSLPEGAGGGDVIAALDRWRDRAGGYPDLLPLWHRVGRDLPTLDLLTSLRVRGIEPMLYVTSTGWASGARERPLRTYSEYLRGEYDADLAAIAALAQEYGGRLIMRWDHEMEMGWCPWGQRRPARYRRVFRYVAERMPDNVKPYWCPGDPVRARRYYPGRAADFVGFDKYSRSPRWAPLPRAWSRSIDELRRRSDQPIIVGEFGRARGTGGRRRWLRTLHRVEGVWAAIYFDIDMRSTEGALTDWRMTDRMRHIYI